MLAADIGGTKTDLAIVTTEQKPTAIPLFYQHFDNREFSRFDLLLSEFLRDKPVPEYACFAIAAPINGENIQLTNFDWSINKKQLQQQFGFTQILLINDLSAVCASLPLLQGEDLLTLQQGQVDDTGISAVIAPGTGLGEGFLISGKNTFFPQGTQGGHCDFAPCNKEQEQLLRFIKEEKGHKSVGYELLCSGVGIPNLYDFFATTSLERDPKHSVGIEKATDKTPLIFDGAVGNKPCPLCQKTLSVFLEILGAEAGNLALKTYCTGGLFIGGGILPRIAPKISFAPFLQAFNNKGKMTSLLQSIPVSIIMRNSSALVGCIHYGQDVLQQ